MEKLGSGLKKVLLAGIGAVAVTGEKSKELLDEMVKKGELTVEQGKALNEELKHNIKSTVKEKVNVKEKTSVLRFFFFVRFIGGNCDRNVDDLMRSNIFN